MNAAGMAPAVGRRALTACLIAGILAAGALGSTAGAETAARQAKKRNVTILVFGDSLADGLWAAIYRRFARDRSVQVIRGTKVSSGFTAHNYERQLKALIAQHKIDALIVQVGANDRQRMVERGHGLIRLGSDEWIKVYRERLDRFIAMAKASNIPVYWVGLPIMRDADARKDAMMMNQIYEEAARKGGMTYISTWNVTSNNAGAYDAYFADENGRRRRFRAQDGIHFSFLGYDRVAGHVLSVIRTQQPALLPE